MFILFYYSKEHDLEKEYNNQMLHLLDRSRSHNMNLSLYGTGEQNDPFIMNTHIRTHTHDFYVTVGSFLATDK